MEVKVKIYLVDSHGNKYMGIGVLWLLRAIAAEGSIRKAAASLSISYSKAHRMMNDLEHMFTVPILERRKGGESRDGATLTPFGIRLIEEYDRYQRDIKDFADSSLNAFSERLGAEFIAPEQKEER